MLKGSRPYAAFNHS